MLMWQASGGGDGGDGGRRKYSYNCYNMIRLRMINEAVTRKKGITLYSTT